MNRIPTVPKPRHKMDSTIPIIGVVNAYPIVIPRDTPRNTRKKLTPVKIIDAINLNTLTIVLNLF